MTDKKCRFIEAYLNSKSLTECCKKIGISRKTAYNYLSDYEVKQIIQDRKIEAMRETSIYMEHNLQKASEILMDIIQGDKTPPSVKVQAINCLFSNYKDMIESIDILQAIDRLQEMN